MRVVNPLALENAGSADFLETADRIVHRICRDAVWAEGACTWLGWTTEPIRQGGNIVFATVGSDLYSGTAGISLLLTRYLQLCPSRQVEIVARGAIEQALAGLTALPASRTGFFNGAAGICHAVIEAGATLTDPPLVQRGLEELCRLTEHALAPAAPAALDVIDGSAGLIPVLLDAGLRFDREAFLASAVGHGDHLLQSADASDDGWSWPTISHSAERNVTGFAHGTAGIANALLELHHQTGHQRFLDGAREGWRYERTHFCRAQNNWPDFRFRQTGGDRPRCATAWCHGASGIGLARLRAWELGYRDAAFIDEIESALASTRQRLESDAQEAFADFSLCHGIAGNAELFVEAARILARPELHEIAAGVGRRGIEQYERHGQPWPCGGTEVGETPNLMLGLAGIGLFYLRLHAANSSRPARIESPLLVRPARRGEDHSADALPRQ